MSSDKSNVAHVLADDLWDRMARFGHVDTRGGAEYRRLIPLLVAVIEHVLAEANRVPGGK